MNVQESNRSSPRIKITARKKSMKQSDSEEENSQKGVLIPILANQKKKGVTGYSLFLNEFKRKVKSEYKSTKNNLIEGQKGAPTQKQISKAAAERW